jgi:hypothetical protein
MQYGSRWQVQSEELQGPHVSDRARCQRKLHRFVLPADDQMDLEAVEEAPLAGTLDKKRKSSFSERRGWIFVGLEYALSTDGREPSNVDW